MLNQVLRFQSIPQNDLLQKYFPQSKEESEVLRARKMLGQTGEKLSDEEIYCIVTEFQFLINSWLDEFEKGVFNGKTLKEVLNEK